MRQKFFIVFIIILFVFLIGCNKTPANGTLKGKVTIGPMCSVEDVDPTQNCQVTEGTYNSWHIIITNMDLRTKIADINPDLKGNYNLELPPGDYMADLERVRGTGSSNLPSRVTIKAGKTLLLNIKIDTGIR